MILSRLDSAKYQKPKLKVASPILYFLRMKWIASLFVCWGFLLTIPLALLKGLKAKGSVCEGCQNPDFREFSKQKNSAYRSKLMSLFFWAELWIVLVFPGEVWDLAPCLAEAAEWCLPWGGLWSGCFSETLSWNLLHGGLLASRLLSTRHNSLRNAAQDQALSTYLILSLRSQQGKSILSCCLILFMGYKKSA